MAKKARRLAFDLREVPRGVESARGRAASAARIREIRIAHALRSLRGFRAT
jgi:hypothetical protein